MNNTVKPTVLCVFGIVLSKHLQKACIRSRSQAAVIWSPGLKAGGLGACGRGRGCGGALRGEDTRRPVGSWREGGSSPGLVLSVRASAERSLALST